MEELLKGIRQSERIFSCGAQMLDFKQRELLDNAGDLYTLPGWAVARERADLPQIMENDGCFFLLWRSGHLPDVSVKTDWCDG